jgi:hypothetical protein
MIMSILFKSNKQILDTIWDHTSRVGSSTLPHKEPWNSDRVIDVEDVLLWEQLYYQEGHVGIYAAWNPYDEFYIIVHNLFLDSPAGIEKFRGVDASDQIYSRAAELGIELSASDKWISAPT